MAAQGSTPHDLVEEILIRLPIKSLVRFKSVSKQWNLLLSDSNFTKTHEARFFSDESDDMNFVICGSYVESIHALRINNDFDGVERFVQATPLKLTSVGQYGLYERIRIGVAHCNGLLCILTERGKVLVWNPTTHEYKGIQVPKTLDHERCIGLGLGYDSTNKEYKVVVLDSANRSNVLSLKTGSWKRIPNYKKEYSIYKPHQVATAFRGRLYWTIEDYSIICFDLERDVMKYGELDGRRGELGILRESLCLTTATIFCGCYDVWVWKEEVVESWNKVFSIRIPQHISEGGRFLSLIGETKVLFRTGTSMKLFLCDLKDEDSVKKISIQSHNGNEVECWKIAPFKNSLARLNV